MSRMNLVCLIIALICMVATVRVVVREIKAIEAQIMYRELRHEPIHR